MLKITIADDIYSRERGLMFVDSLPDDEGMLFVFPSSQNLSFWGKNTLIPLDIAFVDERNRIIKIGQIVPFSLSAVSSDKICRIAVEANAGYFQKHRVLVGDYIAIEHDNVSGDHYLRFSKQHNNKGTGASSEKDNGSFNANLKHGQALAPGGQVAVDPLQEPPGKVEKPNEHLVGSPIGEQPQMANLPIVTKQDIGKMLEDELDEQSGEPSPQPEQLPGETPIEEKQLEPEPEAPGQLTEPAPDEYPQFQTAFEAVNWAEQNTEVVHISYTTKKGRQLERDVEPHGQFHSDSTMRQILVTFDESVGDIRAFIISNIGSWRFTGKKFTKKFVVKG